MTYKICETNLDAMVNLGIIVSPEYWMHVTSIQYLDTLLSNAAKHGMCDKKINNGIENIDTALNVLVDAGIISTRKYWEGLIHEKVQYLDKLLINMSDKCRIVLEKIVHAEAHGESLQGQIHVANVILNRCRNDAFPNGIYNVVFQHNLKGRKNNYQFASVADGAYTRAVPTDSVKQAINRVLESDDISMGATYFCSVQDAKSSTNWHENNLQFLFQYNNLRFYKDE